MGTYKKLVGNSLVFAIGNMGSKLISIILVPLYTYYLTTVEYGTIDLITTTTNLLLPIISLSIYDAALRFAMAKQEPTEDVFSNALAVTFVGSIVAILTYPILKYFNVFGDQIAYMYIILVLKGFQSVSAQFIRAIGKIKIFALNGIIMTFITGIMNILLLVYLKQGISGYLLSIVIANLVSILYTSIVGKTYKYIKFDKVNKLLIKKMLIYSIPLIPNALMWWIMNASSRYFILFFVGAGANGLFAVANKIPSFLSILNQIFSQAWQLSAIEEYESKEKSKFYSEVFNYFSVIMLIGASGILVIIKLTMSHVVASEYYTAWEYVPFLLLGVVFSSFSSFLGTNYIAAKNTGGVFKTSIIGGIVNVISSLVFVPLIGTNGAALSTMISFFVIWIIRVYDTKKFIDMKINIKSLITVLIIITIQIIILYLDFNTSTELLLELFLFLILLSVNKNLMKPIIKLTKGLKRSK